MSRLLWAQLRYFQLHRVRCRTLHSSPTTSDSRIIREKRKLQREKLENCDHVLRLVIDCGLCKQFRMTRKDLNHLVRQMTFCYGSTISSPHPCQLHFVGLEEGGELEDALNQQFLGYASEKVLIETSSSPVYEVFERQDMVYLSPYSPKTLEEVSCSKVYVLGGVVDRSNLTKRLTEYEAEGMDIVTARLPIREHMTWSSDRQPGNLDLPINQVVKILLSVCQDGDWAKAFCDNLAKRKHWVAIKHNSTASHVHSSLI